MALRLLRLVSYVDFFCFLHRSFYVSLLLFKLYPLNKFIFNYRTKKEDKKPWDPFRENKKDTELYGCEGCFKISKIILKIIFILVVFALVLGCVVVSKMCILMIASNLNQAFSFTTQYVLDGCQKIPRSGNDNTTCGMPVCKDKANLGKTTVRWIWCMVMCLGFPYLIVFIRSIRKVLFKKKRSPSGRAVAFVSTGLVGTGLKSPSCYIMYSCILNIYRYVLYYLDINEIAYMQLKQLKVGKQFNLVI